MDVDIERAKRLKQVIEHIIWSGQAFSRKEIAKRIGCCSSTLYLMCNGRCKIPAYRIVRLCNVYQKYNIMFICCGTEPMLND